MGVNFLKKIKDFQKTRNSLKFCLHKHLAGVEESRSVGVVHASDVTQSAFCSKMFALCDATGKKPKGQFIGTSLRATFDLGRSLQDLLNMNWGVKWCLGTWVCVCCATVHTFQKRPEECKYCGMDVFKYVEENFISPSSGVSGSVDYIFDSGEGQYIIVEVKTIVKDDFKKLKIPLAEHRERTQLYLKLIADANDWRSKRINLDVAIILYICKGYGVLDKSLKEKGIVDAPFSPFKEFIVKRDDVVVEPYLEKGKAVHLYRNGGPMPERICSTIYDKYAKACPVKTECWAVK